MEKFDSLGSRWASCVVLLLGLKEVFRVRRRCRSATLVAEQWRLLHGSLLHVEEQGHKEAGFKLIAGLCGL